VTGDRLPDVAARSTDGAGTPIRLTLREKKNPFAKRGKR
jgi:hypothetical protein